MTDTGNNEGFSKEERDAMKARAKELKASARRKASKEEGEAEVLANIAEMPDADRVIAERVHAIVMASAPELVPRLWYGSPAYSKDGKVICFFQAASKFATRYLTLGFSDLAHLDDGGMWSTSFALVSVTDAEEAKIAELVKRATS